MYRIEAVVARTAFSLVFVTVLWRWTFGQQFDLPPPVPLSPNLQTDGSSGRIFVSVGRMLYRLNSDLELEEEATNLTSEAVNISLSTDGRRLVVCLNDLSCEVYNTSSFSAGPVFRREGTIRSTENVALFATEDSFYVGSVAVNEDGGQTQQQLIVLGHHGFTRRRRETDETGEYVITRSLFERNFYSGFVVENRSYFFAVDSNPAPLSGFRVMRVCHEGNFTAMQELTLSCGGVSPTSNTFISGLELVENFAGLYGKMVILTRSRPSSNQNYVCLFDIETIDDAMQQKYNSCAIAQNGQIALAWMNPADHLLCTTFQAEDICHFTAPLPLALDDVDDRENAVIDVDFSISVGTHSNPHVITASTTVSMQTFSFVYLAFIDGNSESFVIGFNLENPNLPLFEDDGFDLQHIPDGPVKQLKWLRGTNFILALTNSSVIRVPVVNCKAQPNCSSCLGNNNPLCGWCVVENKCSVQTECRNSNISDRWIHAPSSNEDNCPVITNIAPKPYLVDSPQIVTLSLTRNLPDRLQDEEFFCLFTSNEGSFTVDVERVGSGTTYICNITGRLPGIFQEVLTVFRISLVSSLLEIPFSTAEDTFELYNCSVASSCSTCLQSNNVCGWCKYTKICSATAEQCINGTHNFLQIEAGRLNQHFTEVCPLLDQPGTGIVGYLHPVQTERNIDLVTRNLPQEIDGFSYICQIGDIELPAIYNNDTSLACVVNGSELVLPGHEGQMIERVYVRWVGRQNSSEEMINHFIDSITTISAILYNCSGLSNGCSSCTSYRLEEGFECGWCRGTGGGGDDEVNSCNIVEDCAEAIVSDSPECPAPMIDDFEPKSGPIEGGTTITITGRELGITFDVFSTNSITVGNVHCTPVNKSYIPGRRVLCTTGRLRALMNTILIILPTGHTTSTEIFQVATPEVHRVEPMLGPMAGGTRLRVWGRNLDIGNKEETRITVANGVECIVDQGTIQADSITCTTLPLPSSTIPTDDTSSSAPIVLLIDSATVSNSSVQFMYTFNPQFNSVSPSNTIPSGGIQLTFTGENLDVADNPLLVIDDNDYLSVNNVTRCAVLNSTAITCVPSPLLQISPTVEDDHTLNYTIIMDSARGPNLTEESLQIRVLPDPGNFVLLTAEFIQQQPQFMVQISADNLASVLASEIRVTVGGGECVVTSVQTLDSLVYCIPPTTPPGGIAMATVKVFIGQYLEFALNDSLIYGHNTTDGQHPLLDFSFIIPIASILLLVILVTLCLLCLGVVCMKKRKRIQHLEQQREYDHLVPGHNNMKPSSNSSPALFLADDELLTQLPSELIIPNNQLQMSDQPIGQGEFGIIYKAQLINWLWYEKDMPVAVKRLKGLHSTNDVTKMLAEIAKMEDLRHPNVMSLIGVHLDMRTGLSIVMPFMANGNLLEYLKRERDALYLDDSANVDTILSVNKLLQRICHQVAKGMEYLALRKFVHRDLAARNCMLDSNGNIKVGDFGLTEDVYIRGYFRQDKYEAIKVPFRWMAPESLRDGLFSEKSDVWSFGITCWEVFSGGRIPYPAVDVMSILQLHEKGTRLEKPANAACSPENFSIMVRCWALKPEDRPNFKQLNTTMDELLQTAAGYSEFQMSLLSPRTYADSADPGYHVIANRFAEEQTRDSESPAVCPQTSHSAVTITTWVEDDNDNDLCTNDAYGDPVIDMRPVFSQETYTDDSSEEHITTYYNDKVYIAMTDNAAYTNSLSVTDV